MNRNTLTFADLAAFERIDKANHILKDIKVMVDWERISNILSITDYRNESYWGRDCYSPLTMFLILLIQRIYGYSDRKIENDMNFNTLYMWFCELSFDTPVPDHVTIHRWRERFIKFGVYQKVFDDFNSQLMEKGYKLKDGTIIDATLIQSASKPSKKEVVEVKTNTENTEEGLEKVIVHQDSKDPDAAWTYKYGKYLFGYKDHSAVNPDGLITAVITTPANVHDGHIFPKLVDIVSPEPGTKVIADKASDSQDNRDFLESRGLEDGIMRRKKPKQPASKELIDFNKKLSTVRFVVERTFGTCKRMYNMSRSTYVGLTKTHNWCLLGAFVYNLARCRKLTWDICVQT